MSTNLHTGDLAARAPVARPRSLPTKGLIPCWRNANTLSLHGPQDRRTTDTLEPGEAWSHGLDEAPWLTSPQARAGPPDRVAARVSAASQL